MKKQIEKLEAQPHKHFEEDDVVLTTDDEFFFYWEAKKFNLTVKGEATEKEAIEYRKEFAHHQKDEQENIAAANYGNNYER
jgi:hypothetical protein